ncbi:MAG TPA: hypothetical protein VFE82_05120 [Ramlibacter sp.]|uniref:hypothetical protein n=1 Tax=Ramlibacter sp. TaxID=1917967 RepID=UPI002D26F4D1|nr:hypothetical protein [Ramlibacter sp.]HZY17840.1 hypothetical protein [Ramlibacter sp.]
MTHARVPPRPTAWQRLAALARAARTSSWGPWDLPLLLAVMAGVAWIRLDLLLGTDFPLNDGALFLVFVQAHARVFPALPAFVGYNGLDLPYAYPPLSFWLAAAAVRLGADPLAIVHRAPMLMNLAWVLLFARLLLRTGHSRLFTAVALLVFGTTFRSYEWLVMGGGLSRGLGSLCFLGMLLALLPPGLWTANGWDRRRLVVAGAWLGATVLSHLEWGLLGSFCGLLALRLAQPRWAPWLQGGVAVALSAACLVLPWLAAVLQVHGPAPFQAASATSAWRWAPGNAGLMLLRTSSVLLPLVAFGVALVVRTRDGFWLLLALASVWLIPRSGETPLVLGVAVLAATGLLGLAAALRAGPLRRAAWGLPAFVLATGALVAVRAAQGPGRNEHFAALAPEARQAMAWVADHHAGRRFAVLRQSTWQYNATAEWFPVLARATSTTTVQGREWLADDSFAQVQADVAALNVSIGCPQLMRTLQRSDPVDLAWVEGIDLAARARAATGAAQGLAVLDVLEALGRRLQGQPPADGQAALGALEGDGTAAGCFEAAGWRTAYRNSRVRIFEAPSGSAPAAAP